MIGALAQQSGQYRTGKYLGLNNVFNDASAPFFAYEKVGEKEKRYNQIIQNLITTENSTIIKTNYMHKWLNQARVKLQDGKLYMITNIKYIDEEINPQAFAVVTESPDILYYLELLEVDESE